jgi:uncharacterized membrane protein YdbT with pleckstrin-like domain
MFTSVDKALVALVMAVIYLVNHFTDFHFALTEDQVTVLVGIVTPILVHQVPNKSG